MSLDPLRCPYPFGGGGCHCSRETTMTLITAGQQQAVVILVG